MKTFRSRFVTAAVVSSVAIALGLVAAGPAGALFEPETVIDTAPPALTSSTSAAFTFHAEPPGIPPEEATFECQLDSGGWQSCSSPENYPGPLSDGSHTFEVRATDPIFPPSTDGTPATYTWEIDTTAPSTTITGGPSGATADNTPTFAFTSPGSTFECSLDPTGSPANSWSGCSSPRTYSSALSDGDYTFSVRATDAAQNTGPAATRSFTVDTQGPSTTITQGPAEGSTTSQTSVHFEFSATGAAGYECDRDGNGFNPCNSPEDYTVGDGAHSFSVRAVDSLGNTGPATTRNWTVDTTGPTTSITAGPAQGSTTNQTSVHFEFSASGAASYECERDNGGFSACNSPEDYAVGEGTHSFSVRALDSLGNTGPATTRNWTVDTTGPTASITAGPAQGSTTNQTSVHFEFSASGAAAYQCDRDGGGFGACNSPEDYTVGEGPHSFSVRAIDSLGNIGPTATRNWTVDVTGPSTSITAGPPQGSTTNQIAVHFEFSATGAASYECNRDGSGFSACNSPEDYTVGDGAHSFSVRATDSAGNLGPATTRTWTVDTGGPTVTINSGPSGNVGSGAASFTFSTTASDLLRFECNLDSAGFTTCSSPANYAVGDGPHTFQVRGVDTTGNTGPTVSRNWTVDTSPPGVSITSGPTNPTTQTSASFTFTSAAPDIAGFDCRLDGGSFAACTSPKPYSGLSAGSHTFEVRARDGVGNTSSATAIWTIDTGAPDVSIDSGPSGATNTNSASFTFSSTASDVARFECRLEAPATFTTCSSPASYSVGDGPHTFFVRAVDTAGNTSSAVSQSWTVDTTAPDTTITAFPPTVAGVSASPDASFSYSSSEGSGSGFQCHLDGGNWEPCPSPKQYQNLPNGTHTFYVRAVDQATNVDPDPATFTWTIDTTEPETTITLGPAGPIAQTSATFEFTSNPAGTFECQLDAGAWSGCSSPRTYPSLAQGSHTFAVRATNALGTTDSTPATRSFTVDTTAPETAITSAPASPTNATSVSWTFNSPNDPAATFICSMDSTNPADYVACGSPAVYNLGDGPHTFRVRAVDALGNIDGTPASSTVTIDTTAPDTTITSTPWGTTADNTPTFTFNGTGAPVAFECSVDSSVGPFVACVSPYTTASLADGTHTFYVRARDAAGNLDASPDRETFTVETVAPNALIDTGPTAAPCADPCFTNSTTARFTFHPDKPATGFECQLTGPGQPAGFSACTSGREYTGLQGNPPANYTFSVRAIGTGGTGSTAVKSFTVDTAVPQTTILAGAAGGPTGTVASNTATFNFTATETSTFECQLDGQAFTACASPFTYAGPLADGPHTFRVRATDLAGNRDPTDAQRSWTIDTTAPTVGITGPTLTNSRTPTFTLSSPDGGTTFECALDTVAPNPPAFTACNASYTTPSLADGSHLLQVRARDAVGNLSAPASHGFTVDATVPTVTITANPSTPVTNSTDMTFQFTASEPGSTFECRLVEGGALFAPCSSPQSFTALTNGPHTFQVRATDPAANPSAITSHGWTINTNLPQTTIDSAPPKTTNATAATFRYSSPNEPGATFQCSIDGTAYTPCPASGKNYTGLTEGEHAFGVKAVNSAGTQDPDPAVHTWTVDTTSPDTTIGSGPPATTSSGFATFSFSSEAGASFECRLDGGAWAGCTSPKIYGELPLGQHSFQARAVDEAGNRDHSPASRSWTVVAPPPAPPASVASGPSLISPFPVIRISGTITKSGVRLRLFLINAPAGSKVTVRCRGGKCPFGKKTRVAKVLRMRTVEKRFYRAGVKIEVFVTKPGMIGKYTRFKIRKGKAPARIDRCLLPGSTKPVRCSS